MFTFDHNHKPVRVVAVNDEPWFVAKDVCDVLGIQTPANVMRNFPKSEVYNIHITSDKKGCECYTITSTSEVKKSRARKTQKMICVNEPGVYRLIFKSRKPEAEQLKTWVFEEVLPMIRKTGKYAPEIVENDCPYTRNLDELLPMNEQLYSQEATEWVLSIMSDVCHAMNNTCYIENSVLRTNIAARLMAIRDKLIE